MQGALCWEHSEAEWDGGLGPSEVQGDGTSPMEIPTQNLTFSHQQSWGGATCHPRALVRCLLHLGMPRHHLCPRGPPRGQWHCPIYRQQTRGRPTTSDSWQAMEKAGPWA